MASYIAELSVPYIRGILTGLSECVYEIGSVIGFWINFGIEASHRAPYEVLCNYIKSDEPVEQERTVFAFRGCLRFDSVLYWLSL